MDFDNSVRALISLTMGMPFREPMPNPTLGLTEKIKPALIGYKAKIANQIGNRVSVSSKASASAAALVCLAL